MGKAAGKAVDNGRFPTRQISLPPIAVWSRFVLLDTWDASAEKSCELEPRSCKRIRISGLAPTAGQETAITEANCYRRAKETPQTPQRSPFPPRPARAPGGEFIGNRVPLWGCSPPGWGGICRGKINTPSH